MKSRDIRRGLWLAAFPVFLAGGSAAGREQNHWPRLAETQWDRAESEDRPLASVQFLSGTDRMRVAETRVRSVVVDSGTASLSLLGGRARSPKAGDGERVTFDRFSIKEAGIVAQADVRPGLVLSIAGNYSLMKRRPGFVWAGDRPSSTGMASIGLALRNADGNRIALDYISVAPGSRPPSARMAELMGCAPLAGSGVQLSLSGKGGSIGDGVVEWSVSGASIGRRTSDSELVGERLAGTDQRLSFSLRGAF